jgi:hypothetical protein
MSEGQILAFLLIMCGIGFGALNRNRRSKGNTDVNLADVNRCRHCTFEEHKDCYSLDCRCKNEVCTEIRKEYWQKRRAIVAALVVGQDIYMFSGCYWNKGKVVKVTQSGVDVHAHELLHFDANGRSYVTELPDSYRSTAHPLSPWGWKGNGTYECGPWYIETDKPFAERDAQFEPGRKLRDAEREALFEKGRKLRDGNRPESDC